MAVPKKKKSKSKTRSRRAAAWRLARSPRSLCPRCDIVKRPHRACARCGWYAGRQVLEVE